MNCLRVAVCAALALSVTACDTPERREWVAADHEGAATPNGAQTNGVVAPGEESATLISVAWRNNCARCHGLNGLGQTQEGRMLRVPDLTRPALTQADDAMLANTIKKGRNKMPSFDLPPNVINGLVAHIRKLQQQRKGQ